MLVEKHLDGRHWRGCQEQPVVPFEDGTVLRVGAGRVRLRRNEWFRLDQVEELLVAVLGTDSEPSWIMWTEITEMLSNPD